MPKTTRSNQTAKAAQTYANEMRKNAMLSKAEREQWLFEYAIAHSTDPKLCPHDLQEMLRRTFDRRGQHRGATKATHVMHPDGWEFHHIVVKRIRTHAAVQLGNQCKFEARTWEHFATKPEADLLCPVYRWFGSRSDKVLENSETDRENLVMICQKAEKTGAAEEMCYMAEYMNRKCGYRGESAQRRFHKLEQLAKDCGWWDVIHNDGNSGVIFDRAKGCYKAVFIDYAL